MRGKLVTYTGTVCEPVQRGTKWVIAERPVRKQMIVETDRYDSADQIGLRNLCDPKRSIALFARRSEVEVSG